MSNNSYRFTEDHEWVSVENNIGTIGVSKFAADELGEVVYVELHEVDSKINKKDEIGSLESVKTVSSIYSPISGKIKEVNTNLKDAPHLINDSPAQDGWIVKIELNNFDDLNDLMSEDEYKQYLETI